MKQFLYNKINWHAISAFSSLLATLCALITVWHTFKSFKYQEKANRPYFTIKNTKFIKINNNLFRNKIILSNQGKRPAYNFEGTIFLIKKSLEKDPSFLTYFSIGNDIPFDSPIPLENNINLSDKNIYYFVMFVKYKDSILDEMFKQFFYIEWNQNSKTDLKLKDVSIKEKIEIEKYIKKFLIKSKIL